MVLGMNLPAPPKKSKERGTPPAREETSISFNPTRKDVEGRKAQLSTPIDFELKRDMKSFAADRNMKLNELIEAAFKYYKANH